jgi:acetyl-CoA C-acetyltransferase
MAEIVIAGAARTPIGKCGGALAVLPAHELGAAAAGAALGRAGVDAAEVDEVVMGQVLAAGQGQNPARQAAVLAGIPVGATAYGVNQVCGSGLRAVALGAQSLALGDARIVVAGGQESMSRAPHVAGLRTGHKMGALTMADSMLVDGLTDAFHGGHMGEHIDLLAERAQVTREEQEAFALESQRRAAAAAAAGRFAEEIAPVTVRTRSGALAVSADEYPRPDVTPEALARLAPAFRAGGTVTAGTASGLNDGAAAVVLMTAEEARRRGTEPLGRIASWATAGVDPREFGLGPIPASRRALAKAGWRVEDLDLIESNEAYAAQSLLVNRDLGWDPARVNVNGGAIALGHPLGASGARVLVTLLHEMARRDARRGLATLCIGGGMGIALCVERG